MFSKREKNKKPKHPYLSGNFAPIHKVLPLTPCSFDGTIPPELYGGQYVRNGANPISNDDLGRDAHWFDGDGMLSGVAFSYSESGRVKPYFVNQFILTDVLLSAAGSSALRTPILPSITTLVNPKSSSIRVIFSIIRTLILVLFSFLNPMTQSIKRISVANTGLLYHDGRVLATCESGPPMRVKLPGLETVGWFDGHFATGESEPSVNQAGFGGDGALSFIREWTTGHPKCDPATQELILYHCSFIPPYVHYSVLPSRRKTGGRNMQQNQPKLLNMPVPGVSGARMMHDFGVSQSHTVIMDLPLSLDPLKLLKGQPILHYDDTQKSRYGVFPRHQPSAIRWYETSACCIFHSANCWDEVSNSEVKAVNMLVCRLTSASLVFAAGNISDADMIIRNADVFHSSPIPMPKKDNALQPHFTECDKERNIKELLPQFHCEATFKTTSGLESQVPAANPHHFDKSSTPPAEPDQCRLYYYRFDLSSTTDVITHQFALSAIPFDFPTLHPDLLASEARFIYGCSTTASGFCAALGKGVKIDVLAKVDTAMLLEKAKMLPPEPITGCVDYRSVTQILHEDDHQDAIRLFRMPHGWYAQEARFVPRLGSGNEDEGYLLFYAFDESQLNEQGEAPDDAVSELWVLDAKMMQEIICRVTLPQRVPYGLHGCWFSEDEIKQQRAVESLRSFSTFEKQYVTKSSMVTDEMSHLLG